MQSPDGRLRRSWIGGLTRIHGFDSLATPLFAPHKQLLSG